MSTHNIGFYEELTKIIFELSSNIIKYAPYFFCWISLVSHSATESDGEKLFYENFLNSPSKLMFWELIRIDPTPLKPTYI